MDIDLREAYRTIMEAVRAEDIFGSFPKSKKKPIEFLKEEYERLSQLVNPENYSSPDDRESSFDAKERLDRFYKIARERVKDGHYGIMQRPMTIRPGQPVIETEKRKYHLGFPIAEGTISTVFDGQCSVQDDFAGRVAIKIVNSPEDNELMWREARVLQLLRSKDGAQRKHLPVLHDKFRTEDNRVGLIFGFLDQSYDLVTIRENTHHLNGVDQKHLVWIMNRALSAIGYAHYNGVVHGNIEPAHLIVRPYDHNLFVVDWSWAAISPANTGDRYKIFTENYSAPEVEQGKSPAPAADLYSLGKCMIYLLGGNVETNEIPDHVEEELRQFLLKFVSTSETRRPQDAWQMHGQLHKLVIRLWGKKKFRKFPM
jgi:serine/threonine protein kinase